MRRTESEAGLSRSVRATKIFGFHRDWRRQGALRIRDWLEDDDLVVIAFDEETGTLAVLPKDSCLEPDVRARDDLVFDAPGGFGKRALKAIDRWRFAPATLDGRPVASVVSIAFSWRQESCTDERSSRPLRP